MAEVEKVDCNNPAPLLDEEDEETLAVESLSRTPAPVFPLRTFANG